MSPFWQLLGQTLLCKIEKCRPVFGNHRWKCACVWCAWGRWMLWHERKYSLKLCGSQSQQSSNAVRPVRGKRLIHPAASLQHLTALPHPQARQDLCVHPFGDPAFKEKPYRPGNFSCWKVTKLNTNLLKKALEWPQNCNMRKLYNINLKKCNVILKLFSREHELKSWIKILTWIPTFPRDS